VTAIDSSNLALVQLLVGHGAKVHDEDIVLAIRMGNFDIAQALAAARALWRLPEKLRQAVEAAETIRQLLKDFGEVRGFAP
jgi:HD-like signal output (HDOD) protein